MTRLSASENPLRCLGAAGPGFPPVADGGAGGGGGRGEFTGDGAGDMGVRRSEIGDRRSEIGDRRSEFGDRSSEMGGGASVASASVGGASVGKRSAVSDRNRNPTRNLDPVAIQSDRTRKSHPPTVRNAATAPLVRFPG